jgi:site-specific DNA-cytosine methylase
MKVLELFAGIGGIGLGLEAHGWETIAFSEFDPGKNGKLPRRQYAADVMRARYPDAAELGDVTTLKFARNRAGIQGVLREIEPPTTNEHGLSFKGAYDTLYKGDVDVIAGGFPCQDISHAGKGAGIEHGTRSGLWRYFAKAIDGLRPRGVIIENVAALSSKGLDRVLIDLAAIGYDAEWDVIPAAGVGAPHLRERMFILAWPQNGGVHGPWAAPPVFDNWRVEPDIPRLVERDVDFRTLRLRCLGNAVVPQVASWVGHLLGTAINGRVGHEYDPAAWDLVKRGRDHAIIGIAEKGVDSTIAGMKLPRAGRLTNGCAYERPRSCPQSDAKKVALENMAPTLRHQDNEHPELPRVGLVPTPNASVANDGEGAGTWIDRKVAHATKTENPTRASMPLSVYAQVKEDPRLIPTPTAKDADSSRSRTAIRDTPPPRESKMGETLTDYVDPTNGGRLPFGLGGSVPAGRLLPTPIATDGEKVSTGTLARLAQFDETTAPGDVRDDRAPRDEGVVQNAPRSSSNGRLNPAWVEWLMGFPAGWTELP